MGALAAAYRPSKRSVATDGQCPVWASTICQYCLVLGLSHLAAHADRSARSAATRFPVQLLDVFEALVAFCSLTARMFCSYCRIQWNRSMLLTFAYIIMFEFLLIGIVIAV